MNVYCLYFPNGKRYVGVESKTGGRISYHLTGCGMRVKKPSIVAKAIASFGRDNVKWRYLATNCTPEDGWALERFFIRSMRLQDRTCGYNQADGGKCAALGVKQSPDVIEKRAATKRGKPHTPEHCSSISKALKGREIKPEWVEKALATKLARGLIRDPSTKREPVGTGRFAKGQAPHNKGTKGLVKANAGSFKKGHKPSFTGTKGVHKGWNKGLKTPEATRRKQSAARKGKAPWNKGKRGSQIPWNKGRKRPPGTIQAPTTAGRIALPAGPNGEKRFFRPEQLI